MLLRVALCWLIASPLLAPGPSSGQALEPTNVQQAAADEFDAGTRAFAEGRYAEAVDHYERAQSLSPHPATAFNLGVALERAEHPLRAWEVFAALEHEAADPKRREEAAQRRLSIEAKISILRVIADERAQVCLDGELWTVPEGDERVRPLKPGPHELRIEARRAALELVAGETRVVHLPPSPAERHRRHRRIIAGTAGAGAFMALSAAGLGTASAVVDDAGSRRATTWAAVGSAGVAAILGTTAIALEMRGAPRRSKNPAPAPCGESPAPAGAPPLP